MRIGLQKNFGPTQIFQDSSVDKQRHQSLYEIKNQFLKSTINQPNKQEKSKSVQTYEVEKRDYYDQLRLKRTKQRKQNQIEHKPIFKLKGDKVEIIKEKEREFYPIDINWQNGQYGRTQGEINGKIDKNYSKIRRYLEGSSSVIDYSDKKTYDKFNSYTSITNQEKISKDLDIMYRTTNNAQPGVLHSTHLLRSQYIPDWIQRGKY